MGKTPASKKIKYRRTIFNGAILVAICLVGIVLTLRGFINDLNASMRQMGEKPVGTVFWTNNTVQRLSSRRQLERLERFSQIYNGDTISSTALSTAKIHFVNGETLELSEHSAVRIDYPDEGMPSLDLMRGEIYVQSGRSTLRVVAAETIGGAYIYPPQSAELSPRTSAGIKTANGNTVKLFQGTLAFSTPMETRLLSEGRAIKTRADGTFLSDPPMMVLSPRNGTRILRNKPGKAPVTFYWQRSDPLQSGGVLLEVSETSSFVNLVGSRYSTDSESTELELAEGTYYWKLYTTPSLEEVDSGRVEIVTSPLPRALFPADGSIQTFEKGKAELRFYWTVPEETEAVLLEVASNVEMNRPRVRQLINITTGGSGSFVASNLESGLWYWRVHPVYAGGVSEGDSLSALSGTGQSIWRVRPIYADVIADDLPSKINSFTLVEAQEQPLQTTTIIPQDFALLGEPHLIFPPDNYTIEAGRTPDLMFSWKNPNAAKSRIQISELSDFSAYMLMDEYVYGSNFRSPYLKPGTYYWHITDSDRISSGLSNPTRLVVTPSLEAPELESPRDNERLFIEESKLVNFSWERKNYANHYIFSLFLDGNDTALSEISSLQNNFIQVIFDDPSTSGRFRWTVQGVSTPTEVSSGRRGIIAEGRFNIASQITSFQEGRITWSVPRIVNLQTYSGDVNSPITLLAPSSGINIAGITALRYPPEARWMSDESLRNMQLILSRTSDPSSDPRAIIKDVSSSSVTFPPLREGIWYWLIRGDTSSGRGVTPGYPFWVNVLPIAMLPAPQAVQPENESVITIAQLTADRNITFRWEEVNGANAYIFTLYREGSPIFSTAPSTETHYVLDNLTILNDGHYTWQAEAVYHDGNDVIEQRGAIVQHPFTIDIQRSDSLQTHSMGTTFGQ